MMTAANRETAVLAVQTVKEVSNMGNRPVNRSRRSAGRGRYSSGRSRSSTLRRRRRNRRLKNVLIGLCCILLVVLLVFGVGKLVERFVGPGKTQLRKEGIEKLNSGDLEGAVADFDQALEKAGNKSNKASAFNADVLWYRAEAEMLLADYEAASHTYDLVAEQGGDKISSLYMKAVCAGKLEDKDQAVSYYREALGMEKEGVRSPGYEEALIAAGYLCHVIDVIGVEVEDKTGNLNDLLLTLKDSNVSVDYLYLSFNRDSGKPIMVFHTEDTMEVRACLKSRGYTVL